MIYINFSYFVILAISSRSFAYGLLEERLNEIFPKTYNKYAAPRTEDGPALVYIQLNIMDIDRIDDGLMEYSVHLYINEIWYDGRLNISSFISGEAFPQYLEEFIWCPDLVFENARGGSLFRLPVANKYIKVLRSGRLTKTSRYNLVVGCFMDFHLYPMDVQKCYLKISLMSNTDDVVLLQWITDLNKEYENVKIVHNIRPLKYTVGIPRTDRKTEIWTSGNFSYLIANFTFHRRLTGTLFNTYIPSTLIVSLSWISFWLGTSAVPARITLGVTTLLTITTQMVQAHSGLPTISYMTAIDVWMFACLITVFSSILEFSFAYNNALKKEELENSEPYETLKVEHLKGNEGYLRQRHKNAFLSRAHKRRTRKPESLKRPGDGSSLDKISRIMFPLLFLLFATAYWFYYLYLH